MSERISELIHVKVPSFSDCHIPPIAMTSAYNFDSAMDASEKFSGKQEGNIYSRFTNPNVDLFEKKVSVLEGAEASIAFSSGMSAYQAIANSFLKPDDHVILANGIFGTTTSFFKNYIQKFGIKVTTTDLTIEDINSQINKKTKMILIESPTNPLLHSINIAELSSITQINDIILVVDNTLLSPIFQRPLELGATLSLNSAGKFFDGQGRCVGGTVSGSKEYIKSLKMYLRHTGNCLSPFNAWILANSLDTLELRMLRHQSNTKVVYNWLKTNSLVSKIYSTLDYDIKNKLIPNLVNSNGDTPIISFVIKGDKACTWEFVDNLKFIHNCTNIGGSKTLISHSATTTHNKYSDDERQRLGITDSFLRLCIGLEDPVDLINDLEQAFNSIGIK